MHVCNTKAICTEQSICTLKTEGQENKTGPIWEWVLLGGGGSTESVKEDIYDGCVL
jgi:hypothetical protein